MRKVTSFRKPVTVSIVKIILTTKWFVGHETGHEDVKFYEFMGPGDLYLVKLKVGFCVQNQCRVVSKKSGDYISTILQLENDV